jgi:hypothetical protein
MKHRIEQNQESETARQRDAFSSVYSGLTEDEFTKSESLRRKSSGSFSGHPHLALNEVAEQVRKFFL